MLIKQLINFTTSRLVTQISYMALSGLQKKPIKIQNSEWQPLIEVLKGDEKRLIRNITATYLSDSEKQKTNMQLIKVLDYTPNMHKYSHFTTLLLVVTSRSINFKHFRQRALKLCFFQNWSISNSQEAPNIDPQVWERFVIAVSQIFGQFYPGFQVKHKSRMKSQYINFLKSKEKYITNIHVIFRILSLFNKIVYEASFIIDVIKFSPIVESLILKLKAKVIENPSIIQHCSESRGQGKIHSSIMTILLKSLSLFVILDQDLQRFFVEKAISDNYFLPNLKIEEMIRMYMTVYRFYSSYDADGKNLVLEKIRQKCQQNPEFKNKLNLYEPFYIQFTFYSIVNQRLTHQYLKTPSYLAEGLIIIKQIKKPQLDEFEIEYFKANQKVIMDGQTILYEIIPFLYPELLPKNFTISNIPRQQKYTGNIDNQIITRISLALRFLGIKYQREKATKMKKKVDFFLTDLNVVLECDGDYHIDYEKLDVSDKTAQRNMLILLQGYKMITISIADYSYNRGVGELAKLIEKKLKVMQEHNAIYVS